MTPEIIQELREKWEAATPGDWEAETGWLRTGEGYQPISSDSGRLLIADVQFIAAAHNHMPALLDALEAKQAEIERLKAALAEVEKRAAQAKADLDYQTEARSLDAKDNIANFRVWKKEHHDPMRPQIAALTQQRDAAIARAEKAEDALQESAKTLETIEVIAGGNTHAAYPEDMNKALIRCHDIARAAIRAAKEKP